MCFSHARGMVIGVSSDLKATMYSIYQFFKQQSIENFQCASQVSGLFHNWLRFINHLFNFDYLHISIYCF